MLYRYTVCPEVEKKLFKDIMHFQYTTNMAMPLPGGMKTKILGHHYHTYTQFVLSMPRIREENYKSSHGLHDHALAQNPLPHGTEIYTFGRPFLSHHYNIFNFLIGAEE